MPKRQLIAFALATFFALFLAPHTAVAATLSNGDFEIPASLANGAENGGTGYNVPGWVEQEPSIYAWEWDIYNPTTTDVAAAHSGNNVMKGLAYTPAVSYVEQVLPESLQNGKRYTLTGWVADPDVDAPANGARFMLFAGTNLLAVVTNTPGAPKTWNSASLVYSSGLMNPFAGQALKIRIMHHPNNSYRIFLDDVSLEVESEHTVPGAPTIFTSRLFGNTSLDLEWSGATGDVGGYVIERAFGGAVFKPIGSLPGNASSFRDNYLPSSALCTYRIAATNEQFTSGWKSTSITTPAPVPGMIPGRSFANVADFGYMWWSNGPASRAYAIKTSRYSMLFDRLALAPVALVPNTREAAESEVLLEAMGQSFPSAPPVRFACEVLHNNLTNVVDNASTEASDVQLVEAGKFFQRRWQKVSVPNLSFNQNISGLETAAWPDRLSFVLRLAPANNLTNATIRMTLGFTNLYNELFRSGVGAALAGADGTGFAFFRSSGSASMVVDRTNATIMAATLIGVWPAGQERSVGVIVYPLARDVAGLLAEIAAAETSPAGVRAEAVLPNSGVLPVSYDMDRGYHRIQLPSQGTAGDDGILRVQVALTNSSSIARVARLNFDGAPFYIPGVSALLRDMNGYPVGIPVQLSKNWHGGPPANFAGLWFHGLSMLTVPPVTTLRFELIMAGQNWGGMPSATHSQLSVIGYGGHQQWDEAALGNYGEALCYDVDHVLTDNDCTDSRPLMTYTPNGETGHWSGNVGGASFLRYFASGGGQRRHARMRTRYLRYCPNLAEVIFAGQTEDGAMDFNYTAGLFRSDDYTRGVHRLRLDVKSGFSFSRLVFFQQAADTYAYNNGRTLAYGDASSSSPLRQWTATFGQNQNIGTPVAMTGPMPWFMTLDSPADPGYTPANRGFVIRSWSSRINGVDNVPPYVVERSAASASLFDIVPPPGVSSLKQGDFVEAEIVRFYVPKFASNYYGPNKNFRWALTNYQNTYRLALREAAGNRINVTANWGSLERTFPIQLQATNNRAGFSVQGGIGSVPVTVSGLSDYRAPVLEEKVGGVWTALNQAVHGNDFWQCDYNAGKGAWEITFTLKLDSAAYADIEALMQSPQTRVFRFRMGASQPPQLSFQGRAPDGRLMLSVSGERGSTYALLSNENLTIPRTNWIFVSGGSFSEEPQVVYAPVHTSPQHRYYTLRSQ